MKSKRWGILLALALVAILLTSCSGSEVHLWLKSPDWSRGTFLGETSVSTPVPMAIDPQGNIDFVLVEVDRVANSYTMNLAHYDSHAGTLNLFPLNIPLQRPGQPSLAWDDDTLRLFWLDQDSLYTMPIQSDGTLVGQQILLSDENVVGSYSLARSPKNGLQLWYAGTRRHPGVFALSSIDGVGETTLVDPAGIQIKLQMENSGTLHAAWVQYPYGYEKTRILYASYPEDATFQPEEFVTVQSMDLGTSMSLDDFAFGLDTNTLYFFWTTSVHAGINAGFIEAQYVQFPIGQPRTGLSPRDPLVPTIYSLDFEQLPGGFNVGPRVPLQGLNVPSTPELQDITAIASQSDELAITFRSPAQYLWRKDRLQVNVAYFRDGEPYAYQPLSFTPSLSALPNIISDADGHLYLVWMEKVSDVYSVYFSSTLPAIVAQQSGLTAKEVGNLFVEVAFGMLVGALLTPIVGAVWMIAPMLALLLLSPIGRIGSGKVKSVVNILGILLTVGLVWVGKLAVLPGMFDYVPFSAWIPQIPMALGTILRYGVPVLTFLIAAYVAWYYTYKKTNDSSLYFVLIYIGVDALITMAIYAVLIYGALAQ